MSFRRRIACLLDTPVGGTPNACEYIRLILPLTLESIRAEFEVRFMRLHELPLWSADVIIVQRTAVRSERAFAQLTSCARANGSRIIFEIDDDLPALGLDHPEHQHYVDLRTYVLRLVGEADQVWVSTRSLAAKLSPLNQSIEVLANYLDNRVWRLSTDRPSAHPLRVLYFGSPSHREDFEQLVKPAFSELRARHGRAIELTLVGVAEPATAGEGIAVIKIPSEIASSYPAFVNWLRSLGPFHLGLAPLTASEFNRSKSHIKWLEYAALGAVSVASRVGEYSASIEDGATGVLFEPEPQALVEAIGRLVESPNRRESIKGNAVALAKASLTQGPGRDRRAECLRRLLY